MPALFGFAIGIAVLIGVIALSLWIPSQNWSYLWRRRTKKEMILWMVVLAVFVLVLVGSALFRL